MHASGRIEMHLFSTASSLLSPKTWLELALTSSLAAELISHTGGPTGLHALPPMLLPLQLIMNLYSREITIPIVTMLTVMTITVHTRTDTE